MPSETKPLTTLLDEVPGLLTWPLPELNVTGVTADSRQIEPGYVFVARAGDTFDGHDFIPQALRAGAAAVVGERPADEVASWARYLRVRDGRQALAWLSAAWWDHPARRLTMIGVTGTDGKTTTVNLLYQILRAAGLKTGMISTVNAVIPRPDGGESAQDTGLHVTTPEAPDVQRYLARMVAAGTTHAILETTSHGLAQHRVTACEFDLALVTNVTHEHLDYHGDWERYFAAKARLFEGLSTAARKPGVPKIAVLNADDASYPRLQDVGADRLLSYSLDPASADVGAREVVHGTDATRFSLIPNPSLAPVPFPVETRLIGDFNVSNVLAAATAALGLGLSPAAIQAGVGALPGIPGRMERVLPDEPGQPLPFMSIVDFAHTPNALRRALETARRLAGEGGRVIAVWGSAGLRDREKRRLMGQVSARLADLTVISAEDPRTESLEAIMAESAAACRAEGLVEGRDFWRVPDRGKAIRFAVQLARSGDVVIACGKGHEQSMCFGTTEYPWDDREAMRRALRGETLDTLPTSQGAATGRSG